MGNCLDTQSYGNHLAGNEEMVSDGLWSLRKADGLSYLLVEVETSHDGTADVDEARGPKNSLPSGWSCRQLRHLVVAFRAAGCALTVPEEIAVTDADGMTWRPDKAPPAVKDAIQARQLQEQAEAAERARARGDDAFFIRNDPHVRLAAANMRRTIVGDGPINPPGEDDDLAGSVLLRPASGEPFRVLRGSERQAAILSAVERGTIARYGVSENWRQPRVETVQIRARGDASQFTTQNEDGTLKLHLGDLVFPKVMVTSCETNEFCGDNIVAFQLATSGPVRRTRLMRTMNGGFVEVPSIWR